MNIRTLAFFLVFSLCAACTTYKTKTGSGIESKSKSTSSKMKGDASNPVYVMNIEYEIIVTDSAKHDPNSERLISAIVNEFDESYLIHDRDRIAKVEMDDGKVTHHLVFTKSSNEILLYVPNEDEELALNKMSLNEIFDFSMIPEIERKMKEDGILTVDESKEYVLHEYNCKRIKFQENEDSLAEFYLSEDMPMADGALGVLMNTMFDLGLKTVMQSKSEGLRIIKECKNKRIDFEFMHYLELNENTYSSGK